MYWTSDILQKRKYQNNEEYKTLKNERYDERNQQGHLPEIKNKSLGKDLEEKVQKFISINKKHEFDQVCVCQDCIYAKQFRRYDLLKMDLSKNTSYRAQYNKHLLKRSLNNTIDLSSQISVRKPEMRSISKSKYVNIGSNYKNQFASRSLQKIEKPRPQDQLKFNGPSSSISSYKVQYPKLNGPYQYMEPLKREKLPSLKFNSDTNYSDSFRNSGIVETESMKMNDQLRLGKPSLVKQSTNQNIYNSLNPEIISMLNQNSKSLEKRLEDPNYSYQYKTINRQEYEKPPEKKNCRNKRLQALYGQMLTSPLSS